MLPRGVAVDLLDQHQDPDREQDLKGQAQGRKVKAPECRLADPEILQRQYENSGQQQGRQA